MRCNLSRLTLGCSPAPGPLNPRAAAAPAAARKRQSDPDRRHRTDASHRRIQLDGRVGPRGRGRHMDGCDRPHDRQGRHGANLSGPGDWRRERRRRPSLQLHTRRRRTDQQGQAAQPARLVQRPEGWRLFIYHEVQSLPSPPTSTPGTGKECVNPCRTVPYEPANDNERAVIAAFMALETASHAADVANWGTHVADEFILVSSNSDRTFTRAERIEGLRKSTFGGVSPPSSSRPDSSISAMWSSCAHSSVRSGALRSRSAACG